MISPIPPKRERGAALIEYALIIALILLIGLPAITTMGSKARNIFCKGSVALRYAEIREDGREFDINNTTWGIPTGSSEEEKQCVYEKSPGEFLAID